jgi:hypothetical protein
MVRGKVREGYAVTDAALSRRRICGPYNPSLPFNGSAIRLETDVEGHPGLEVLGQFDTGSRSAQITRPARPVTRRRGVFRPVQERKRYWLADEPPLGPPF